MRPATPSLSRLFDIWQSSLASPSTRKHQPREACDLTTSDCRPGDGTNRWGFVCASCCRSMHGMTDFSVPQCGTAWHGAARLSKNCQRKVDRRQDDGATVATKGLRPKGYDWLAAIALKSPRSTDLVSGSWKKLSGIGPREPPPVRDILRPSVHRHRSGGWVLRPRRRRRHGFFATTTASQAAEDCSRRN